MCIKVGRFGAHCLRYFLVHTPGIYSLPHPGKYRTEGGQSSAGDPSKLMIPGLHSFKAQQKETLCA